MKPFPYASPMAGKWSANMEIRKVALAMSQTCEGALSSIRTM